MPLRRAAAWIAIALIAPVPSARAQSEPPLPTELEEEVEVRLVTVDVVALDAQNRTVADLTKDDVELIVDGEATPIDTWDAYCDGGSEADPESRRVGDWATPKDLADGTRRIVLAFDYLHLPTAPCPDSVSGPCFYHTQALRDFQHALAKKQGITDEETMVVALTGGLRVEQPFTKDRAKVIDTLRRMEHDISLWNGNFRHLTATPLFRSMRALITLLRTIPGPKAVVFVSIGGPSFRYDLEIQDLAAAASDAGVSIYPIDCRGLFGRPSGSCPACYGPTGAPGLAHLASMTGGRLTERTNDYSVGYARARRDLGCRYTIGFYDRKPKVDQRHSVIIDSKRKGVHLRYAARYTFPSKARRRQMAIEAAYLVPAQFEGGGLRAHLFPLQPQDAKAWNAVVAVDFPIDLDGAADGSKREFGVILRRGPDVVHTFNRSITLARDADDPRTSSRVTFIEPVMLSPGRYTLSAVLIDPKNPQPFGHAVDLAVPGIPKREAILAGPILGRRRGDDVVVYGSGDHGTARDRVGARDAFRPLLIDDVDRGEPLAALTHVCLLKAKPKDGPWSLSRKLETADGAPAGSLADQSIRPEAGTPVQCERWLDELPVRSLRPGRYTFRALLAAEGASPSEVSERAAPFAVSPAKAP